MTRKRIEWTKAALDKGRLISHLRRIGKPLPIDVKEKLRKKALDPKRLSISIQNLPKYKKGEHPTKGKPKSIETRLKMSLAKKGKFIPWNKGKRGVQDSSHLRGANHPNWRGGTTTEKHKIYSSWEYKLLRKACFERDNYTCIFCGKRGTELQADHIKPYALFPELRFALDNLRTLCVVCHRKTDTWGYSSIYRKKNDSR